MSIVPRKDTKIAKYKNTTYLETNLRNISQIAFILFLTASFHVQTQKNVVLYPEDIQIPANSSAGIYIPKLYEKQQIMVNGHVDGLTLTEDPAYPGFYLCKSLGNGSYHLTILREK